MTTNSIWKDDKHQEWKDLALRTEPFIDRITGRNDIYVIVKPDTRTEEEQEKESLPAGYFTPAFARLTMVPNKIFDKDTQHTVIDVDPCSITSQRKYPNYVGVAAHEAAHGRHSGYNLPPLEGKIAHWVAMIEEPRAERWMLEDFPQYAVYIKSIVMDIVGGREFFNNEAFTDPEGKLTPEMKALSDRYEAAGLCFLIMARADSGVFEYDELEESEIILRGILGDDDYDDMHAIWLRALDVEDDQPEEIIALAHEVQAIVDPENKIEDQPEEDQVQSPCGSSMPSQGDGEDSDEDEDGEDGEDGEDADGEGNGQASGKGKRGKGKAKGSSSGNSDDDKADGDNGDNSENGADGEDTDGEGSDGEDANKDGKDSNGDKSGKDGNPSSGPTLDGLIHKSIRRELDKAAASAKEEIADLANDEGVNFSKNQPEMDAKHRATVSKAKNGIKGVGVGDGGGWYNRLELKEANPAASDVSRARAMEIALRQAQYREVTKTVVRSVTPPGRLSMRGMMNREAQVAARQEITATPWAQTHRRMVDNPPITLAVATDISGSMDSYQREVGSFTWAFAHAIKRLQGKVGAVAWDGAVHEYIEPGKTTDLIPFYRNGGTSEGLPAAIFALDGLMNLSFGEGVRVLTVITDGQLPNTPLIQERINILHSYGVQVLWILTGSSGFIPKNCTHAILQNTNDFGNIVGRKVIELLEKA